jgi:hypothetical protein
LESIFLNSSSEGSPGAEFDLRSMRFLAATCKNRTKQTTPSLTFAITGIVVLGMTGGCGQLQITAHPHVYSYDHLHVI